MPYIYKTYKNGFTERFSVNETPAEELESFKRSTGVRSFPSRNHPSKAEKAKESKEPPKGE